MRVVRQAAVVVKMKIAALQPEHFNSVAGIYEEGMATGVATFETEVPDWTTWDKKFLPMCRYVMLHEEEVVGWCALSPASKREVYRGVAEVTIYVAASHQRQGIGKRLLSHLIVESEKAGFWTLQASIFSENKTSIRLHEQCGFRLLGYREKIAQRDGQWFDKVLLLSKST
ncbi:MAG: N-acetyltransferase family protein, partial [Bacteroidota bacterium]